MHQILKQAPLALNLTCVSVFEDSEEAKVVSLGSAKLKMESIDKANIFDLSVPYPYLLETVPSPWFSHSQILKTGVGQGVGTSCKEIYRIFLDGISLVEFYNQNIVSRGGNTKYTDDAIAIKRIMLKLKDLKTREKFEEVRKTGLVWANPGFEYLLCGALDEAYSIEIFEESMQSMKIDKDNFCKMLCPILWYNKVHHEYNFRHLPFRDNCEKNVLFCCLIYTLNNKHAPWREKRETKHDPETAAVLQQLHSKFSRASGFVEQSKSLADAVSLFSKMVKINSTIPQNVDITEKLYTWASDFICPKFSRASVVFS